MIENIIQSIQHMDAEALFRILPDNRTYNEVYKNVFIETLNEELEQLKARGFTKFDEVFRGRCLGCNEEQRGFSFRIKDEAHLDLIFEIDEENNILDIVDCSSLSCSRDSVEDWKRIRLRFYRDDEPGFLESAEFHMQKQKIDMALLELHKMSEGVVTYDELEYWISKHEDDYSLMDTIFNPIRAFQPYRDVFTDVCHIVVLKREYHLVSDALKNYSTCGSDSKKVERWLSDHHDLASSIKLNQLQDGSGVTCTLGEADPMQMTLDQSEFGEYLCFYIYYWEVHRHLQTFLLEQEVGDE